MNNVKYEEAYIRTYSITLGAGARGTVPFLIPIEREFIVSNVYFHATAGAFDVSFNATKGIFENTINLNASIIDRYLLFEFINPIMITGANCELVVQNVSDAEDTLYFTLMGKITVRDYGK